MVYKVSQPEQYIVKPTIEQFKHYQEADKGHIKYITMATETDDDFALTRYLTENGIISTVGTPVKGTAYFIIQDSKGVIWIATKGAGLIRAEATSPSGMSYKLTRNLNQEDDMYSLRDKHVYCVSKDNNGRTW